MLEGARLRLEPLTDEHAAGLWRIAEPEIFTFMNFWWSAESEESFHAVVSDVCRRDGYLTFAMRDKESGDLVGSSAFFDIRPEHRSLEIGATWIGREYQGTWVNPAAKLLMLEHAFDTLGCIRVQLKTDSRNTRSRRAMEKLGAKPEGILRAHMICRDGYVRDTAMYSIIVEEWPAVKEGLRARLRPSFEAGVGGE